MNFLSQEICGGPLQKGCRIFLFPGGKCKNSSYNFVKSIQKICICAIITPNRPQPRPCAFRALMLLYTDAIENQLNTLCSAPQKRCRSAEKGGTGYDGRKDRAHQCAGQKEPYAEEKAEQASLRREYIDAMKGSLKKQLDNTVVVDANGNRMPLKQKRKQ